MQKIIQWLSQKDWAYKFAIKLLANRIVHGQNILTPEYLTAKGWVVEDGYFVQPDVVDKYKTWVKFDDNCYRVWYGEDRAFVTLAKSAAWLELYLLPHQRLDIFRLAGV